MNNTVKYVGIGIVVVVGLVAFSWTTTIMNTASGVVSRTLDPDNVLTTYESFHDRWKQFEARKAQIASYQKVVDTGDSLALMEQEAMRQSCRELAATYNADAIKSNRSIFMGQEAPESLDQTECDK